MKDRKHSRLRADAPFASTPMAVRELLDASPDAIFCCDVDGSINWISPAIESITGFNPGDLLGHSCTELVAPRERIRFVRTFHRLWTERVRAPFEVVLTLL